MINPKILEGISAQVGQLFSQNRSSASESELQQQLHALLQGAFRRMDLVTREEFDAQSTVLARSRAKLEQLQAEIERLEQLVESTDR